MNSRHFLWIRQSDKFIQKLFLTFSSSQLSIKCPKKILDQTDWNQITRQSWKVDFTCYILYFGFMKERKMISWFRIFDGQTEKSSNNQSGFNPKSTSISCQISRGKVCTGRQLARFIQHTNVQVINLFYQNESPKKNISETHVTRIAWFWLQRKSWFHFSFHCHFWRKVHVPFLHLHQVSTDFMKNLEIHLHYCSLRWKFLHTEFSGKVTSNQRGGDAPCDDWLRFNNGGQWSQMG